jgi:MOSC domain-containing protein YiiM
VTIKDLMQNFSGDGVVKTISVRPARREPVELLNQVEAIEGRGLTGDRYNAKGGTRQVTLIQQEHLDAVASYLGQSSVDASMTRRNIVVQGINLLSLKGKKFQVGEAVLEYSGECHPCSRMEENLGTGGYNAMRGHGGITARVVQSGTIRIGDPVKVFS